MESEFYSYTKALEHEYNVKLAESRIRHLGYGRRGVALPVHWLGLRRLAAAVGRRLEEWGTRPTATHGGLRT